MKKVKVRKSIIDSEIGSRVRMLRIAAGLSQSSIGKELDLTFQQVQKYEKGANRISGSRIIELCKILNTTPNALLGYGTDKNLDPIMALSVWAMQTAIVLEKLSPDQRRVVAALIATMSERPAGKKRTASLRKAAVG